MSQSPKDMSLAGRLLLGGVVTAMGLSVEAMALGVIRVDPSSVHAPMWILLTAGGMFALVGVWIMAAGSAVGGVGKAEAELKC